MIKSDDKKPKKRINSKAKGNGHEGQIAKKLTAALQPLNFIRSPGSGARVGGKNFETIGKMFGEDALKIFVGDVVPVNELQTGVKFRFNIEAKFYAVADNFSSLASGTANVFKWVEESINDAMKTNRAPALIFKWNRTDTFVALLPDTIDVSCPIKPLMTLLTYERPGAIHPPRAIDIYSLDDLLKHPSFWFLQ